MYIVYVYIHINKCKHIQIWRHTFFLSFFLKFKEQVLCICTSKCWTQTVSTLVINSVGANHYAGAKSATLTTMPSCRVQTSCGKMTVASQQRGGALTWVVVRVHPASVAVVLLYDGLQLVRVLHLFAALVAGNCTKTQPPVCHVDSVVLPECVSDNSESLFSFYCHLARKTILAPPGWFAFIESLTCTERSTSICNIRY